MIDFGPHNLTQANSPLPWVVSASSYFGQDAPWKACDGSIYFDHPTYHYAGTWWTANASTGWWKIDCGVGISHILLSYGICLDMTGSISYAPKSWTVEGSNDNSTWDTLATIVNEPVWKFVETRQYTCDVTTTAYRYFRLSVTANEGGTYLRIGEIFLYRGIEDGGPPGGTDVDDPPGAIRNTQSVIEVLGGAADILNTQTVLEVSHKPPNIIKNTQNVVEVINKPPNYIQVTQMCVEIFFVFSGYTDSAVPKNYNFTW